MTQEEIRDEVDRLQGMAKTIKEQVGMLRNDVCSLQGSVNRSTDKEVDKKIADIEKRAYQAGYANGLAEGYKQAEDSCEGCASAKKPMNGLLCMTCRRRYPDKYQQADEPDDEIRVGDEVIAILTDEIGTAVVTNVNNKKARYIYANGTTGWDDLSELKKTGRHFPEVEKLLEAMKG